MSYTALSTFGGATIRGNSINVGQFTIGSWTQSAPANGLYVGGGIQTSGSVNVIRNLPQLLLWDTTTTQPLQLYLTLGNFAPRALSIHDNNGEWGRFDSSRNFMVFGNVGIGTTTPAANLQVNGTVLFGTNATAVTSGFNGEFGNPNVGNSGGFRCNKNSATAGTKVFSSYHANSGVEFYHEVLSATNARFIFNGGNVGIGTTNPTNKLEVNGTIRTKEVIVETTGWSDYVFAPDYRLAPLSEVEAHIAAKGTLPGIPSAAEVAEHGVSVGDMQAKLLAKLEEMTLHVIALSKKVDAQAAENAALRAEIAALRAK
jgi:hypothetical protein